MRTYIVFNNVQGSVDQVKVSVETVAVIKTTPACVDDLKVAQYGEDANGKPLLGKDFVVTDNTDAGRLFVKKALAEGRLVMALDSSCGEM